MSRPRGFKHSEETRKKIGKSNAIALLGKPQPWKRGEKHWAYTGASSINELIRKSSEYKLWRRAVFERDNYTCIWCFAKGGRLNADHIKPFAYFPELRFAIDNGRTLCEPCHRKTDTYSRRYKHNENT